MSHLTRPYVLPSSPSVVSFMDRWYHIVISLRHTHLLDGVNEKGHNDTHLRTAHGIEWEELMIIIT